MWFKRKKHGLENFYLFFELQSQGYLPFTFHALWGLLGFSAKLKNISSSFSKEQIFYVNCGYPTMIV